MDILSGVAFTVCECPCIGYITFACRHWAFNWSGWSEWIATVIINYRWCWQYYIIITINSRCCSSRGCERLILYCDCMNILSGIAFAVSVCPCVGYITFACRHCTFHWSCWRQRIVTVIIYYRWCWQNDIIIAINRCCCSCRGWEWFVLYCDCMNILSRIAFAVSICPCVGYITLTCWHWSFHWSGWSKRIATVIINNWWCW
jgi:hypothetical protein